MSLLEVGNAFFRGELKGANGSMKMKLTADAIDVVDTVNFKGGEITYNYTFKHSGRQAVGNSVISGTIVVVDANVFVEIVVSAYGASVVYINGGARLNRNQRGPGGRILPFVDLVYLPPGTYTIDVHSSTANIYCYWAVINCRYIRRTGTENL